MRARLLNAKLEGVDRSLDEALAEAATLLEAVYPKAGACEWEPEVVVSPGDVRLSVPVTADSKKTN